jgi:hypothetical protein
MKEKIAEHEIIGTEISLQRTLIKFISQCLYLLPYWLPEKSYTELNELKKNQQLTIEQRQVLSQKILSFLAGMQKQLKDKGAEITESCLKIYGLVQDIEINLNKKLIKNKNIIKYYQNLTFSLETNSKQFFELITKAKSKSLKAFTLYDLKQDAFAEHYELQQSAFRRAKYIQHRMNVLEKLLGKPDSILSFAMPKPLSVIDWLDKRDYADLLFLLTLISPEYLEVCLEQKFRFYQEILDGLQNQVTELISYWEEQTAAITRSYRILGFYQRWQIKLEQTLNKLDILPSDEQENLEPDNNDWTTLFTFLRLFTYEKKTFFTEVLKKENALLLFSELTSLIDSNPHFIDPEKILNYLSVQKQELKDNLAKNKDRILNKYPLWQKVPVFFGLALTEHPTYKIGKIGFDLAQDFIDQIENLEPEMSQGINNKIDQWGNLFVPAWLQEKLNSDYATPIIQNLAGLVCYLVDQGFSSWVGYSYRALASLHRTLFSQFDSLVSFGAKIAMDEISLLEKEMTIHWLSGLGIYLFLQDSDYWMPTFFSYTLATISSFGATIIIDELIKDKIEDKEWNPKIIDIGKFVIQSNIYSWVYLASFKTASEFLQSPEELTSVRALKVMGFYAQPSKRDLQKRYHELARQYHSDKCLSLCESEIKTMTKENPFIASTADCLETCENKDQTMREINQAYSCLKSFNI